MKTISILKLPLVLLTTLAFTIIACNGDKRSIENNYYAQQAWRGVAPDFRTGDISPDGKYFTDINWVTGNLEIIDIEMDTIFTLQGNGYNEGGYSWMSSFSNKGDRIAYEWYNYDTRSHELRLYNVESKQHVTFIDATEGIDYLEPLEWKKEDDSLLIARSSEGSNWELGYISMDDTGYRQITELNWNVPGGKNPYSYPYAALSSDNTFIGFDYRMESSKSMDLFIVSTETGEISPLWEGDGEDRFMYWDDSDEHIYFYSDRSGIPAVWKLAVENGKALGDPVLILENIKGLTAIGKTTKGFAFGTSSGNFNTYYGAMDFETGEEIKAPEMVDSIFHYRNNVGTWSKDGDSLMYIQFRSMPAAEECVVIKSIKDHKKRVVTFPWSFHNKTGTVAWPSPSEVLIDGGSPDHFGLHVLDLNTGKVKAAFDHGERGFYQRFETNSNGSKFYIEMRGDDPGIVVMDPVPNTTERLVDANIVAATLAVSPDDQSLVYLRNDSDSKKIHIDIYDLETRNIQTLASFDRGILANPVNWTADGKRILVGARLTDSDSTGLWSIAIDDPSDRVFIEIPDMFNSTIVLSPDGQHYAYQGGTRRADLFFIKNE